MSEVLVERELAGGRVLRVMHGDLTDERVDAIVNAANSQLAHGGGVAGAIVRKGGAVIQEESSRVAPVPVGETAVTSAGGLPARYVIHAVGPVWGEGDEDRKLYSAFYNSLKRAGDLECKSVSLPAISSGIFGFPKERCAKIFVDAVESYLAEHPESSLREIRATNIDQATSVLFSEEVRRRVGQGGEKR
ncbi:MAG: macro domain-containing protein [Acidobacteriota bacterium]